MFPYNKNISNKHLIMKKGLNCDFTQGQYFMLYNIVVNAQPKDANPDFDMQTYENLVDAIVNANQTYIK